MSERIQEIRDEIKRIEDADGVLFWSLLKVAKKAADLLETLEHELEERDSIKKLVGPSADMPTTTAMRELVNSINAKNLGAGIDYSADKDILCVAFAYGEQASYAVRAIEEKLERENPQPLTLLELAEMEGKPVYDGNAKCWLVIESVYIPDEDYAIDIESNPHTVVSFTDGTEMDFDEDYFYLYATEPKGETTT